MPTASEQHPLQGRRHRGPVLSERNLISRAAYERALALKTRYDAAVEIEPVFSFDLESCAELFGVSVADLKEAREAKIWSAWVMVRLMRQPGPQKVHLLKPDGRQIEYEVSDIKDNRMGMFLLHNCRSEREIIGICVTGYDTLLYIEKH